MRHLAGREYTYVKLKTTIESAGLKGSVGFKTTVWTFDEAFF